MTTISVFSPIPDRTTELRAKGWTHRCMDLKWCLMVGRGDTERAVCVECGSSHFRWAGAASEGHRG